MADNILIGTVSSLSPLKVQLVPNDTELPVVPTSALLGIDIGSRIVLERFSKLFIGIAVIKDSLSYLGVSRVKIKQSTQSFNNNTRVADNELFITLEANKLYKVFADLVMDCSSESPDAIVEWVAGGTITLYGFQHARGASAASTNPAAYEEGKSSAYGSFEDDIIFGLDPNDGSFRISFYAKGGVSGGLLTLWCSQRNTDGSNPARMLYGSSIEYKEVIEITD